MENKIVTVTPPKNYALPDHVVLNIITLVNNADIKGGQAPVIMEILKHLESPQPLPGTKTDETPKA